MARRELGKEIGGLIAIGGGVFLFLCLFSFHPQDPSLNLYQSAPAQIHNLGGLVGAYLSDILWQVFGCASFLFPLIFVVMGVSLFANCKVEPKGPRWVGFVLLLIAISSLLDILMGEVKVFSYEGIAGGVLGKILGSFLKRYLSVVGATFFVILLFLSSMTLTTGISLRQGLVEMVKVVKGIVRWIIQVKDLYYGKWRKKKNKKESVKRARITRTNSSPPVILSHSEQRAIEPRQEPLPFPEPSSGTYHLPSLSILESRKGKEVLVSKDVLFANSQILESKLKDYGVEGKVVGVRPGPIVTVYEFEPASGVKVTKILNLEDDLALALSALSVRIQAPVPGKPVVGIEIPNPVRESVCLKAVVNTDPFLNSGSTLTLSLGCGTTLRGGGDGGAPGLGPGPVPQGTDCVQRVIYAAKEKMHTANNTYNN